MLLMWVAVVLQELEEAVHLRLEWGGGGHHGKFSSMWRSLSHTEEEGKQRPQLGTSWMCSGASQEGHCSQRLVRRLGVKVVWEEEPKRRPAEVQRNCWPERGLWSLFQRDGATLGEPVTREKWGLVVLQRLCPSCCVDRSEVNKGARAEAGRWVDRARDRGDVGRGSSHQLESPKSDERLGWRGRTKERGGQGEFWHLYLSNWIEGRALGVSGGEGVEKRVCWGGWSTAVWTSSFGRALWASK